MTSIAFLGLADVDLGPGVFRSAQDRVRETLLGLSVDRLLAPFRREAGLPPRAESYGGWESTGLDGHTAGHVLSALSTSAEATGDGDVRSRAEELVAGLRECQVAGGTGYVGGIPDGARLWDELRGGDIRAATFDLNDRWVPLYNLHKTFAGLVDASHAQVAGAREVLDDLVRWWDDLMADLTDQDVARILVTESGGLSETLALVSELTGDARHLVTARRLLPRDLVEPLADGRDVLDGLHANTQAPVAVGLAAIDRVQRTLSAGAGDERCRTAAQTFWTSVARRRSVAIGAASVRENFHRADDFDTMFTSREGPESCLTYNMVKLSGELFRTTGDDAYLAYAERALTNHLLSTQHPEHGGTVYFTSMRPGHYRTCSAREKGFWCCVGTGLETHTRHGALAFSTTGDELGVNLLVDATARWRERGVTVRVVSGYPLTERVTITVEAAAPVRCTLAVRIPTWVDGVATATVDGEQPAPVPAGQRLRVEREWTGVTTVDLDLPARAGLEHSPDGGPWTQVLWGPLVLAHRVPDDTVDYLASPTRMGHVAGGPLRPLLDAPVLGPQSTVARTPTGFTMWDVDGTPVALEPFATLHDARYVAAWPYARDGDATARRAELAAADRASLSLAARTLDEVAFGEQQPEVDHGVVGTGSVTGREGDARWRSTTQDVRLTLFDWRSTASSIQLEWLDDVAPTALRLVVAGRVVLDDALAPGEPTHRTVRGVDLPPGVRDVEVPVQVHAAGGLATPRLLRVRLLASAGD